MGKRELIWIEQIYITTNITYIDYNYDKEKGNKAAKTDFIWKTPHGNYGVIGL